MASELSDRHLRNALRSALKYEARRLKRAAGSALKSSGVRGAAQMARDNIQTTLLRDGRGVRVYVSNKGERNMHVTRRGLKKPVAFWLEGGTAIRATHQGWNRGRLRDLAYMQSGERVEMPGAQSRLGVVFEKNIEKTFRKHGY